MSGIELRTDVAPGWLPAPRQYLSVLAIGNLVWEFLHMPLYTLWSMGT